MNNVNIFNEEVYYYDDNGNMDMHNDSYQNSMSWTIDNRLKQVSRIEDRHERSVRKHVHHRRTGQHRQAYGSARFNSSETFGRKEIVAVSSSAGSKLVHYHSSSGTDYLDANGDVHIYLGASAESGFWQRFERNIKADYEGLAGGSSWTNTDGLGIILGTGDMDTGIDDMKLSNSMTKTFNALTGGSVGQIAAAYDFSDGAPVKDVAWYNYDHIGNVQGLSDSNGGLANSSYQDAYGNVLSSITTGAWASSFSGRHLTTKEHDGDGELYYFWQRWVMSNSGRFLSRSSYRPDKEHPYDFGEQAPINWVDPQGKKASQSPQVTATKLGRWGWWCGLHWSGGLTPDQSGPARPPCGPMDECCMAHDNCYGNPAIPKATCDAALCACAGGLTIEQLGNEATTCCQANGSNGGGKDPLKYWTFINNFFCGGNLPLPLSQ